MLEACCANAGDSRVCRCRTKGSLSRWPGPGLGSDSLDYTEPSRSKEEGVLLWVRIAVERLLPHICKRGATLAQPELLPAGSEV